MPGMSGLEATRVIHAEYPSVRVIALSMFPAAQYAQPLLAAGAAAYLSKSDSAMALLDALRNPRAA